MLQQILAQNPHDAFARYGLAMEYANRGDFDLALSEFALLIQANPDYTPAYQMSAQTLLKSGREAEARTMLQDGIACAERTRNQHALSEMQALLDELR